MTTRGSIRPLGFTCECGKWWAFAPYVYAHWRDLLVHTCADCQRVHEICLGSATLVKGKGRKRKAAR